MKLVFAGTPEFAERALAALIDAGHRIEHVLTQPDRPAGRGQRLLASPVKRTAAAHGLPVLQPATLRDPAAQQALRDVFARSGAQAMVVAAYGLLLPAQVLQMPPAGCLNIHASLLPRWRGAAPIQRAIEAGDRETGITIMQMDAGLDTGPILLTRSIPIADDDTGATLHDKLAELGAQAIVDALARLERGELAPLPQPQDGVTYARKIGRDDAWLDWTLPAPALANRVRAFDPVPGAATALAAADSPVLKIWRAAPEPLPRPAAPGTVILAEADRIVVAAGNATALRLLELQRPGGRRLPAAEFLRGHPLAAGAQLRAAPPRAD